MPQCPVATAGADVQHGSSISLEILLSIGCSPAHPSLGPGLLWQSNAICWNIFSTDSAPPGLDHMSFNRTEKEMTMAGDVGDNYTLAFQRREGTRTDNYWSEYRILLSGAALLCRWQSLLLLHSTKSVVEHWQWQHYNDPSPRSTTAIFLVFVCHKGRGKTERPRIWSSFAG